MEKDNLENKIIKDDGKKIPEKISDRKVIFFSGQSEKYLVETCKDLGITYNELEKLVDIKKELIKEGYKVSMPSIFGLYRFFKYKYKVQTDQTDVCEKVAEALYFKKKIDEIGEIISFKNMKKLYREFEIDDDTDYSIEVIQKIYDFAKKNEIYLDTAIKKTIRIKQQFCKEGRFCSDLDLIIDYLNGCVDHSFDRDFFENHE